MKYLSYSLFLFLVSLSLESYAENGIYARNPATKELNLQAGSNLNVSKEGYELKLPGSAVYTVPDGEKGWYIRGLMSENDGVIDARHWYGMQFDLYLDKNELFDLFLTLSISTQKGRHDLLDSTTASIKLQGKGWHSVTIPFHSFDFNRGQEYMLKYIKNIRLTGKYDLVKAPTVIAIRSARLIRGNPLYLDAEIRSKPGDSDSTVCYQVLAGNSSDRVQQVNFSIRRQGWEAMKATVSPAFVTLEPGQEKQVQVLVTLPASAPGGAQEKQTLLASTATSSETMDFITVQRLEGPYLIHTKAGWQAIKDKVNRYDWAKEALKVHLKNADEFVVPEVPKGGISGENTNAIFSSSLRPKINSLCIAWALTNEKKHAEKIALLLKRFSAPDAYPTTLHAGSQWVPQEGELIIELARGYDLIRDEGILTQADKNQIEHALRLYVETIEDGFGNGGISNWSVFNLGPAAQCALVLQDFHLFNELLDSPCGLRDHFRYGLMDDGWWYEVSLGYNLGCAEVYTQLGLAAQPFGIDLLHEKMPVSLSKNVGLRPFEYENFEGMAFGKFGPIKRNFLTIKDMWDAIVAYPDYRGVMFGMGDGHESLVGSGPFEMAYFAFRDSSYASVLKQSKTRDLVYGIPELPAQTPLLYSKSAHSDNAGVAVLRSQTEGREQKEQIQAALKYGTHGSYHGHFDRMSLLSLMRYGRSFWNPETSWFGYGSYMYKWWVQTSMASNMVVVDGKMQEPTETIPSLFYSGKMMQAMVLENTARWSNPPYFGGYQQIKQVKSGDVSFVPVPDNHPEVTAVTDYTEPVLQRRLMVVTDDYVVLADYLKGTKEHTFDNLLQLRGARPDSTLKFAGHDAQFDESPLSSGQFITSVDNFRTTKGATIPSRLLPYTGGEWERGGFNGFQEPGILNIDVHHVWPQKGIVRIGNYAEGRNVSKKLVFSVLADNKILTTDSLGTWILGKKSVDVSIKGVKNLQLRVWTNRGVNGSNTLFWANARIVTSNGRVLSLASLKPELVNTISNPEAGKDYQGGPVKIAGNEYNDVVPAEPSNTKENAIVNLNLDGLNAVRFLSDIGGDYPVGDEDQLRKTVSYRTSGKEVRFLTVLEPYDRINRVTKVKALSANELLVELSDGSVQHIKIENLDGLSGGVSVSISEEKKGQVIRSENTNKNE